jgi:alpha-amylase
VRAEAVVLRRCLALLGLALSLGCSSTAPPDEVATTESDLYGDGVSGTAVSLSGWRWQDIMSNMGAIRDAGYTAILISPHTATCSGAYGGNGYDPSDHRSFDGGFGSEHDLYWLVKTAHWFGVQIYADMVMNHMCTHGDYAYARFSWNDFHHDGSIQDWNDEWDRENRDLFGLNDLAQESPYVRSELFAFLVKTNDMGFDGYRWDAAKHVPRWFWRDHVVNNTNAWGKFSFGEVYDADLRTLRSYVDTGMAVTDYNLHAAIRSAFAYGGDLTVLDGAGFAAENGARALTFVENHDVGAPANRYLAYAFLAGYPGYPMFANVDVRDATLANLVWVHNHKAFGPYVNRWKEHDVFVFERAGRLLVGLNQSGDWQERWVDTSWSGTRLHDYTGHTDDVWTSDDRRVRVRIPPTGWVMLAP